MSAFAGVPFETGDSSHKSERWDSPRSYRTPNSVVSVSGQRSVVSQLSEDGPRGFIDDNLLTRPFGLDPDRPFQSRWDRTTRSALPQTYGLLPSWRLEAENRSYNSVPEGWSWRDPIRRLESSIHLEMESQDRARDRFLDKVFAAQEARIRSEVGKANEVAQDAMRLAQSMSERVIAMERNITRGSQLAIDTGPGWGAPSSGTIFNDLTSNQRDHLVKLLLTEVLDHENTALVERFGAAIDLDELATRVGPLIDVERFNPTIDSRIRQAKLQDISSAQGERISQLEREFREDTGAIQKLRAELANLEARGNTGSSERAGYVFTEIGRAHVELQSR